MWGYFKHKANEIEKQITQLKVTSNKIMFKVKIDFYKILSRQI